MLHFTKSLCTILIGVWLLLFMASEARADAVVFSNFGPGMTFNELQGGWRHWKQLFPRRVYSSLRVHTVRDFYF